mmetsp:Transcript_21582/g.27236  ORF Transcript_21582/g.27236 Transcript_21582/m.27236 type:complete len:179 (+) Transcript_21582:101-637(+)
MDIENIGQQQEKMTPKPKLVHSKLHDYPQDLRYFISGLINTAGFMFSLWMATVSFREMYSASTIYAISNLFFIPIGHAVSSLLVFGWPEHYVQNLLLNAPIGLVGTAIGSFATEFLDRLGFDAVCHGLLGRLAIVEIEEEAARVYTSIMVMIVTGVWGYIVSNIVNSSPTPKKGDKEL